MDSYDVRFRDIKKPGNGSAARFRVRWAVDGREHGKSFKARPLADGFPDGLKDAVRDRRPFSPVPACRTSGPRGGEDHLVRARPRLRRGQMAEPGPGVPPLGRRALVTVTIALTAKEPGTPGPRLLRQSLFAWAFNPATRDTGPPPEIAAPLDWAERGCRRPRSPAGPGTASRSC